ncbi:OsmC family protein [Desulfomonile tiedjei]|uniref:Putative redox protein, regulator of disulfide bond formation n=1 Tax=Desulfomonile tiedjei (strain ATCC 49306 / DSM 6799 / DCB-1) TaxID=706587 RepID=I4C6U4_DESTA|nr:OsmC family protein [Desulfomonile tiedjei]AFM25285.1 putative redox protein, regulator of disulfide bond formation [Desulfomonile tiedjei DSM 6799]
MKLLLKQTGPRKVEVITDNWSFIVDLKEEFGGENSGPNPSELFAAAVASCEMLTGVVWASRRHDIELKGLEAEVQWEYEERPERISKIDVTIRNAADQLDENIRAFTAIAQGCAVTKTLKIQPDTTLKVE